MSQFTFADICPDLLTLLGIFARSGVDYGQGVVN